MSTMSEALDKLKDKIEELHRTRRETSREYRTEKAEKIVNEYVEKTGRVPSSEHLLRLEDIILHEELSDPRPDRITLEEYPILSYSQIERRVTGKFRNRNKNNVVIREVPIDHAENVASDGKNYTLPIRNFKNPY